MCTLGKALKQTFIEDNNTLEGYRGWYLKSDGYLYPLNQNVDVKFEVDKNEAILDGDGLETDRIDGFYSYNNYYNYYNNYYNNYYYNNYYNNNYNYNYNYYNNHNYNNDYNNDYNYNYYVAGKCNVSGDVIKHEIGYRSTRLKLSMLVRLTSKEGLEKNFQKFLEHFNSKVDACGKLYNIPVINHVDFE